MTIAEILYPEIQKFICDSVGVEVSKLALQKNPFPVIDYKVILNQIEAKRKAKDKLPTWFKAQNIIYPSKVSVEQTSSEITAKYKSDIVSGNSLIDLSGGFGVDDYYYSKTITQVSHCEINEELSTIVSHNFNELAVENINCYCGDSSQILEKLNQKFDWIYVDPSRRNEVKGKVFMMADCLPNVPELQDFYYQYSNNILIKTAPILDITAGLSELKNVKRIHIVAVENEVKELLWEIKKNYSKIVEIKTINFNKLGVEKFDFNLNMQFNSVFNYPLTYLYEPNSAVMKSGGFAAIGQHFQLEKLHQHSHLYTSHELKGFPGRVFEIKKVLEYSKKDMISHLVNQKMNITIRNFPDTVENIRKRWKIKEGGNDYCFFTTDKNDKKIVLICAKINF